MFARFECIVVVDYRLSHTCKERKKTTLISLIKLIYFHNMNFISEYK